MSPASKMEVPRFKLIASIRADGGWKKIFQKPLAGAGGWARFLLPVQTGTPFFLFEKRFDGSATEFTVCTPARFSCPAPEPIHLTLLALIIHNQSACLL